MTQQNPNEPRYRDDEIDLGELLGHIWQTKWRVLGALVIVGALFVAFKAVSVITEQRTVTYNQVFDLTFDGLSDGEFPDGSPFVMSDILSPGVLNRVYRFNSLDEYGLSLDQFRRSLNIEPWSPDYFLIQARYQRLLSENNLSASEAAELQQRMRDEMSVAQSGSVRLSMQGSGDQILPRTVAKKVLLDIANVWAERAIEERGVLRLDLPIYSERIFDEQRFEALDYLLGIELLLDNIELIQGNVAALKEQPNAANITDDETGYNLEDLEKAIKDVAEYDLRQLIDPVKELGLTRNENVVQLYYNRRLQELELEKRFWQQRAEVIRSTLVAYGRGDSGQESDSGPGSSGGVSPQLGDAFLDRLVEISRQGGAQEFRQAMTRQILEHENQALDIEQEMEQVRLTLNAISAAEGDEASELRELYVEEVQESLPNILRVLREYTAVVGRLHDQLGRQASGSVSELIRPQGGAFGESQSELITRRDMLTLIALLMLTGFVSLFGCLVYDMMRRRREQTN